jgi:hypothetical protein
MTGRDDLERSLVHVERYLPYLRRHVTEFDQAPSPEHRKQAYATLRQIRDALECIDRFLSARDNRSRPTVFIHQR